MAKKKTTKKKAASNTSSKPRAAKSKKSTKKKPKTNKPAPSASKSTRKKKSSKKRVSKKSTKKTAARKSTSKSTRKKSANKKTAKKKTTKKTPTKKSKASPGKKKKTTKSQSAKKPIKKSAKKSAKKSPANRAAGKSRSAKSSTPFSPTSNGQATGLGEANSNGHQQLTDAQMKKVKTGLTKKDLKFFQQLLLEKRAEIVGDVAAMDLSRNGGGELSHMPLHMADIGSDNYEQEFTLGLVESERKLLTEIDEALLRISNGTYGVCVISGTPIGKPRLEVQPWAKYCIEIARERERRM